LIIYLKQTNKEKCEFEDTIYKIEWEKRARERAGAKKDMNEMKRTVSSGDETQKRGRSPKSRISHV
jgi:hypothetical protein